MFSVVKEGNEIVVTGRADLLMMWFREHGFQVELDRSDVVVRKGDGSTRLRSVGGSIWEFRITAMGTPHDDWREPIDALYLALNPVSLWNNDEED